MPATIHIVNRYINSDNVARAAVVFDGAAIDAKSPRTHANGQVVVATETLSDGNHVMNIVPDQTSADAVGPAVAEGLGKAVTRMYRSLNVNVTVSKGKITTVTLPPAQALNGAVLAGVNPVRVQLQPVYFRSPYQNENDRAATNITLIVVHQTEAAADIGATLRYFTETRPDGTSAHYVISPEAAPQAVKVVQDTGRSWQAGKNTSWRGKKEVNHYSIGIELSHKTGTPFPPKQIDCLVDLIGRLRAAYPSIPADGVVGHMDVLLEDNHNWLAGRDCPGLDLSGPCWKPRDSAWFLAEERRTSICTVVSSASRSRPITRSLRETPTSRENGATSIWPDSRAAAGCRRAARSTRGADRDRRADHRASDRLARHRLCRAGGRPLWR